MKHKKIKKSKERKRKHECQIYNNTTTMKAKWGEINKTTCWENEREMTKHNEKEKKEKWRWQRNKRKQKEKKEKDCQCSYPKTNRNQIVKR